MKLEYNFELCGQKIIPPDGELGQFSFFQTLIDLNCDKQENRILKVTIIDKDIG